ncbi:MAG: hypothetical protein JWN39_1080 [Ilumatobacteraceae bacterium]|nr:hypothetical protein [Ilumatobacteraceae bacterium]
MPAAAPFGSFRSANYVIAIVVVAAGFGLVPAGYIGAAHRAARANASSSEKVVVACWALLGIAVVWRMARCRIMATADHLIVVGFVRTRRLPWAQVDKVVLKFKSHQYFGGGAQTRVVTGSTSFMLLAASAGSWSARAKSLKPLLDAFDAHGIEVEGR